MSPFQHSLGQSSPLHTKQKMKTDQTNMLPLYVPFSFCRQVELVGARMTLSALTVRYQEHSPMLAAMLLSLGTEFPDCRSIAGDGNCFYRGFLFGLMEALLSHADMALHHR